MIRGFSELFRAAFHPVPTISHNVINAYPHDINAFTQGLAFENGTLFESTGQYGRSSLRRVDLLTGKILQMRLLPDECFGEGITIFGDTIIQLTWKSRTGFIYDKKSFEVLHRFTYATEGWGITYDGSTLIMSDGTSMLQLIDARTFKVFDRLQVKLCGRPLKKLNDLEFINGRIFANVWRSEKIAIIDPRNGNVSARVDLSGISPMQRSGNTDNVLNGIAFDNARGYLLVTGKMWPRLFEVDLKSEDYFLCSGNDQGTSPPDKPSI